MRATAAAKAGGYSADRDALARRDGGKEDLYNSIIWVIKTKERGW